MNVWVDVSNPPQVQYLYPLGAAFEERGHRVLITARALGATLPLLAERHAEPLVVGGGEYGASRRHKITGTLQRARSLTSAVRGFSPDAVVCANRATVIAARRLGVPSFAIVDYEFVHLALYKYTRTTTLYPDVIDPDLLRRQGIPQSQLVPFSGLKEDISFAGVDLDHVEPHEFPEIPQDNLRVLVRPPADDSHYYQAQSTEMLVNVLERLSSAPNVTVIFSPRRTEQVALLSGFDWANAPVVLTTPIPFVPLLKASDMVVSSGGTMVREAAFLGVPAFSTFGSELGGVDSHLANLGRIRVLRSRADVEAIRLDKTGRSDTLITNPRLATDIAEVVESRVPELSRSSSRFRRAWARV